MQDPHTYTHRSAAWLVVDGVYMPEHDFVDIIQTVIGHDVLPEYTYIYAGLKASLGP